ncbi:4Fe-4S dicluster domain-containing protein [Raoultibacter phocaeensis]|uniref:4Fe-4S dicluster domain-containing protein n=1 Tax=Raoultibacter phocaeensis TaxID=2479841 RepID=UPI001119AA9B|nr:4Fe-4S dicluster domain-containing protein [Raoultibacter phocaeensis]
MQDDTSIPRRTLLQGAAVLGVSALAGGALALPHDQALAQDGKGSAAVQSGDQYGFLVRTSNCVDCQECVQACRRANNTPENVPARRTVTQYTTASSQTVYVSTGCMHCAEPACATVCPARAITKGDGGVVSVDPDRCIGCKYCYQACPFSVPHYTSVGMDKCDCCLSAGVALGEKPYCVRACKFRALHYGTLEELMAGSGGRAKQIDSPTGPSYLLQ